MEKYEPNIGEKKNKRIRYSLLISFIFLLILLICAFITGKAYVKNSGALNKQGDIKKTEESIMDKRESTVSPEKASIQSNSQYYGELMPWVSEKNSDKKIAYLTFDDGPSPQNTEKILGILRENNIKATFFLIGKNAENNKELVQKEISEGHVIGNHTYSHELNYKEGPEKFVEDVNRCDEILKSIAGSNYNSKLLRFPGGSWDTKYLNLAPFRDAVSRAGYHFVNWNDLNGDAEHNNLPVDVLVNRVVKETRSKKIVVILMHDAPTKATTVQALPRIIQYLKSNGYTFDTLK